MLKLAVAWMSCPSTGAPRLRVTAEQMELSKLRKEVQDLKMERDILKKAAAYFARTSK